MNHELKEIAALFEQLPEQEKKAIIDMMKRMISENTKG